MGPTSSLSLPDVLGLSAYTAFFLKPSLVSGFQEEKDDALSLFSLLETVGYSCSEVRKKLQSCLDDPHQSLRALNTELEASIKRCTSMQSALQALAAKHFAASIANGTRGELSLLSLLKETVLSYHPETSETPAEDVSTHAMMALLRFLDDVKKSEVEAPLNALLFALKEGSRPSDLVEKLEKRQREREEVDSPATTSRAHREAFLEGQLFGVLSFLNSFTSPTLLSKLIITYLYQGTSRVEGRAPKGKEEVDPVFSARAHGVVGGLLSAAFEVARRGMPRVLHGLVDVLGTDCTSAAASDSLSLLYPAPGESGIAVRNAGILLAKLVEWSVLYEDEVKVSPASQAASNRYSHEVGTIIIRHLHELILTLVLGGSTASLNTSSGESQGSRVRPTSYFTGGSYLVVQRGLTLAEADAFVSALFPSFLQSVGYEWTWSETLRCCRAMDKIAPPYGTPSSSLLPVRWSSAVVMDHILLACSRQTYPSRLYQLLPGSFHPILEALGLKSIEGIGEPNSGENDGSASIEAPPTPPSLFTLPPYYAVVGAAIMAYWDRVGTIQAIRIEELQQIIHSSTAVLPMIVQIRAMGPSSSELSSKEEETPEDGDHVEILTAPTVEALTARYQAEALVAAVVVYTQLAVPSQVHEMLRLLAPMIEKYLMTYRQKIGGSTVGGMSFPLFTTATHPSTSPGDGIPSTFPWRFSHIFRRVCGDAGYQLYPLEWWLHVGEMHQYHGLWLAGSGASTAAPSTDLLGPMHPDGNPLPYSLLAAVWHQFGLTVRARCGSGGSGKDRLPQTAGMVSSARNAAGSSGGAAASPVTPPLRGASDRVLHMLVPSPSLSNIDASKLSTQEENDVQKRVDRFIQLLETVFLTVCRDSAHGSPAALFLCKTEEETGCGFSVAPFCEDEGEVISLIQARDFWLVAYQALLPSTEEFRELYQKEKTKMSKGSSASSQPSNFTDAVLGAALRWCKDVIGDAVLEQQLESAQQQLYRAVLERGEGEALAPPQKVRRAEASLPHYSPFIPFLAFNSATLDASFSIRRLLRLAPTRLLEKTIRLKQISEDITQLLKNHPQQLGKNNAAISVEDTASALLSFQKKVNTTLFLLRLQYEEWTALKERCLGMAAQVSSESGTSQRGGRSSARSPEWWWSHSPYFSVEWQVKP